MVEMTLCLKQSLGRGVIPNAIFTPIVAMTEPEGARCTETSRSCFGTPFLAWNSSSIKVKGLCHQGKMPFGDMKEDKVRLRRC
jgi:hypothetical protein